MHWLISENVAREMRKAIAVGMLPSAEQRAAYERTEAEAALGNPVRGMNVAGDTAEIRVEGVLTPKPDLFAMFFGGGNTTYRDIQAALAAAQVDPAIRKVTLMVSSPGGTVEGLFETLGAIEALKAAGKSVTVKANQAHSAAYAIAAVAGRILADTPASMFGSVGVAASFFVDEEVIDIANTESPNKRPDVTTPEGQDVVRQELDALFEIFVDAIARGRGVKADVVKETFGRGASFVASEAARRGMIDKAPKLTIVRAETPSAPVAAVADVVTAETTTDQPAHHGGTKERRNAMTKDELKAQHPEAYEAVFNEGKAAGETSERDRVCAHLQMGEACGDLSIALAAVRGGEAMTQTNTAKYLAAGMNRSAVAARQADSDAAGAATATAAPKSDKTTSLLDLMAGDLPVKKAS